MENHYSITFIIAILFFNNLNAQVDTNTELFQTLSINDSLLFEQAFNQCQTQFLNSLIYEDFEFYHDQSGVVDDKEMFITGMREGLCKLPYKARRELVAGSLQVFPMYNKGQIYGALQMGAHHFYAKYPEKEEVLTSTAKFTHVWQLINGKWRFTRALSYDHHTPDH